MLTLVFVGQGTPAPFDPPRQLVVSGPYRYSRNPMYIGAGIMVFGAALFYQSLALFSYGIALSLMAYLFVVGYEEPTLRNTFRHGYPDYCREVRRWVGRRQKRGVERSER
jgi:protein-S-isoprenylcysteine O-methyltransferase Ste14